MGWSKEGKVKLLVKAYLTLNKNRKCTSKEIAHFVNSNPFGLGKYDVTSVAVTRWIKEKKNGFFRHVKMERKDGRNVWHFWVEA